MRVSVVGRVDDYQRRHSWLGLPLGVVYKFFDDRGNYLAALVAYYAFVSLFPLLLLFYSVLGFILQGHSGTRHDIEQTVLKNFPGLGPQLGSALVGFRGSGAGLAIGVLGTLYGGLGAMQAAQAGFNQIYGVARNKQPNPIKSRVRSLGLLALLGTGVLLSTTGGIVLSTVGGIGPAVTAVGYILNFIMNAALFSAAFRLLTARDLQLRQVLPGGLIAAGAWLLIQIFGSSYISHALKHSRGLYGIFATVLVTLAWMYLQSLILMVCAELNVVLHRRLWPRSLLTPFTDNVQLTAADRRAYRQYAEVQRFKGFETVTTEFKPVDPPAKGGESSSTDLEGPADERSVNP